jgi:ATP phosphoribosyltransferase regulatory subunit
MRERRAEDRLRVAVPKGALFEGSIDVLEMAGLDVTGLRDPKRQLRIFSDDIEYIIAKPTDVAIYVANGAADCGIGGKDILVEADYPLLEFVDLRFGGCKFVVAQPAHDTQTLAERALRQGCVRVATKYPRLTSRYFDSLGIQSEIVKLNGNIELAPLIGISDVIVDITATGTTLRENDLVAIQDVSSSTARFVANPASARTDKRVSDLAKILYDLVEEGR